jgi:hypothetical protein
MWVDLSYPGQSATDLCPIALVMYMWRHRRTKFLVKKKEGIERILERLGFDNSLSDLIISLFGLGRLRFL